MKQEKLNIRNVTREDLPIIAEMIRGLAKYEKRPQDVTGTIEQLEHWLFDRKIATVLLGETDGRCVAYALYYPVFGSFAAAGQVHLEDLYILPECRGKGYGLEMMSRIAADVLDAGYIGMEWSALDWNENAIGFYRRMGAHDETGRAYMFFDKEQLEEVRKL